MLENFCHLDFVILYRNLTINYHMASFSRSCFFPHCRHFLFSPLSLRWCENVIEFCELCEQKALVWCYMNICVCVYEFVWLEPAIRPLLFNFFIKQLQTNVKTAFIQRIICIIFFYYFTFCWVDSGGGAAVATVVVIKRPYSLRILECYSLVKIRRNLPALILTPYNSQMGKSFVSNEWYEVGMKIELDILTNIQHHLYLAHKLNIWVI